MALATTDNEYLALRCLEHIVTAEGGMTCVVFPSWQLPAGYDRTSADLLIRLQFGFPDVKPDMWWFDPAIHFADGREIQATQVREQHLGRTWQRWSRHLDPTQWRPGVDGLANFLALISSDLTRCAQGSS